VRYDVRRQRVKRYSKLWPNKSISTVRLPYIGSLAVHQCCIWRSNWCVSPRPPQSVASVRRWLNQGCQVCCSLPEHYAASAALHTGTVLYLKQLPAWRHRNLATRLNTDCGGRAGGRGQHTTTWKTIKTCSDSSEIPAGNWTLTHYKTLRLYTAPITAWHKAVCAHQNGSASDP